MGKPIVKILAGVRRCGKSTIFEMLKRELIHRGMSEENIIQRTYTNMDMPESITAKSMHDEITASMRSKKSCCLLLDEIQEQGKGILKTQEKYYLADMSLKYALLGYNRGMLDGAEENIVFLELKRRGYNVFIGKNGAKEIDFVAEKRGERIYVQVCVQLPENSDREIGKLMEIGDNYPKYVVTLNDLDTGAQDGIKVIHLYDFLTAESL